VLKESMLALEKLADIRAIAQGGYPQVKLAFCFTLCICI